MRYLTVRRAAAAAVLLAAGWLGLGFYALSRLADDPWEVPIASHRKPLPPLAPEKAYRMQEALGLSVASPAGFLGRLTVD